MKGTWLKDNVRSIIALIVVISCLFIMIYGALFGKVHDVLIASATNILMFVLGYYYSASKDKVPPTQ